MNCGVLQDYNQLHGGGWRSEMKKRKRIGEKDTTKLGKGTREWKEVTSLIRNSRILNEKTGNFIRGNCPKEKSGYSRILRKCRVSSYFRRKFNAPNLATLVTL